LISLCYKSVKVVSCTRINIFAGGDCLINIPIEVR
jgi:molybdopterin biosynthesis enzyme